MRGKCSLLTVVDTNFGMLVIGSLPMARVSLGSYPKRMQGKYSGFKNRGKCSVEETNYGMILLSP